MCGIAGIMMKPGHGLRQDSLDRLQQALLHRGPNSSGRFQDQRVGLVSTRLSIVDLDGGHQPLYAPNGTVLIANGEIYNAPELRAQLGGYPFESLSDCEPMLPLFEKHGEDFVKLLRGMYAVALYEPASGRLHLLRDPFGIKPLYYTESETCFAFASEPQALLQAGLVARKAASELRPEFLQLKYTTGNRTLVAGLLRVAPGETMTLEHGEVVARRQMPAPSGDGQGARQALGFLAPRTDRSSLLHRLERTVFESVEIHLRMDAKWCLFLSGGVDSSILLTVARQVSRDPVRALTLGYSGKERVDESEDALRFAASLGVDCTRVEMSPDHFWQLAPRIVAAIDDPTTDPAVLPTWMLAAAAAERGNKVVLTGEGADEVFGGYSRYRRALLPRLFPRKRQRRGVYSHSGIPPDRFGDWYAGITAVERRERAARRSRPQVLQGVDIAERLPNSLLVKLDRCLMAHGIEGRTPFLDRKVVGFAAGLPDRLKVDLRYGKVLLREWLARLAPQAQPYARKRGFGVPLGRWMQDRRRELAPLVGAQSGVAELFSPDEVTRIFNAAAKRDQPAWSLLFYALWHSHHILGVPAEGDIADVLGKAACLR
jgi:asparagine synthase (glutamine-hydrolysing)